MKNLKAIACSVFWLICNDLNAPKRRIKAKRIVLPSADQQLKYKRSLQKDIERLRALKRLFRENEVAEQRLLIEREIEERRLFKKQEIAELRLLAKQEREEKNKALVDALEHCNLEEIQRLLDSGIDVNEQISWSTGNGDEIIEVVPLVLAAMSFLDLEMVKLLLKNGAKANFVKGSLLSRMLKTFSEGEDLWGKDVTDREEIKQVQIHYLTVLQYLFRHFKFDKDRDVDSQLCSMIWKKILVRVKREFQLLGAASFKLIHEIDEEFFSRNTL